MMESPQAKGIDESTAKCIVNAFAGQVEKKPFILFTPGAAALPENELSFIAAHEIGHHALGHTRHGLHNS
jgi:Zn-dependent protease with chaperone function